jgi:hypothetical protein
MAPKPLAARRRRYYNNPVMGEFKNEFSWSKTRDEALRQCPRMYYFQYYGFWGGWKGNASPRTRELYILKNLDTFATWIGRKVHECLDHTIQNLRWGQASLPVERVVDLTLQRMRQEYVSSWEGRYRRKLKTCGLFEHEYGTGRGEDDWRDAVEQVDRCLKTFYASAAYARLQELPGVGPLLPGRRQGLGQAGLRLPRRRRRRRDLRLENRQAPGGRHLAAALVLRAVR